MRTGRTARRTPARGRPTSVFDKYQKQGSDYVPDPSVTTPDVYRAPTATDPGTGFTPFDADGNPSADYGLQLTLKIGSSENRLSSGWFQALDLPNADGSPAVGWRRLPEQHQELQRHGLPDWRHASDSSRATWLARPGKVSKAADLADGTHAEGSRRHLEHLHQIDSRKLRARVLRRRPVPREESPNRAGGAVRPRCLLRRARRTARRRVTITNIMGFFIEGMGGRATRTSSADSSRSQA